MTHPETPEVGGEPADAKEAFENIAAEWLGETDQEEEPAEAIEGDEPEITEELTEDDIEDEAEADDLPPIDAPVSWDAEAKELFKTLPREAQEIVQKREAERERFVQQKSQEAARARSDVEQAAYQQLAQIDRQYAQQYQQTAAILEQLTADPDYSLLAHNPQEFARQAEVAKYYRAQLQQVQHLAQQHTAQANEREQYVSQAEMQREHQAIVEAFPEYLDPTNGPKLRQELSAVARELGYPSELIEQARAPDILAMRTAAEWKAKADQLDRLNAKKMEKVRAAKGLPKVAKPGASVPADRARAARANAAWERTKSATDMAARSEHFADYLKSTGQI